MSFKSLDILINIFVLIGAGLFYMSGLISLKQVIKGEHKKNETN